MDDQDTSAGRWTQAEHDMFVKGLEMYSKQWKLIADLIKTRTVVQVRTHAQKYFLKLHKHHKSDYISVSQGNTSSGVSMAHADPNQPKRKVQGTSFTLRAPKQRRLSEGSSACPSSSDEEEDEESFSEQSQSRRGSVDYTDNESSLASSSSSSSRGASALSSRPRREKAGNRLKLGRFSSPSPKSVMDMDSPRYTPSRHRGSRQAATAPAPAAECSSSSAHPSAALPVLSFPPRPEAMEDAADWFTLSLTLPPRTIAQAQPSGPFNLFPASLLDQPATAAVATEADPFGFGACDLAALDYHWLSGEACLEEDTLAMSKSEMRMNLAAVTQALAMSFVPGAAVSAAAAFYEDSSSSSSSSMTSCCSSSDDGQHGGYQAGVKEARPMATASVAATATATAPIAAERGTAATDDDDDGMDDFSVVSGILEAFAD